MSQALRLSLVGASILVLLGLASLQWGSVGSLDLEWVLALRLPRALLAIAVGAGLAVAGTLLQLLFQNALAEPYTLGVSSGAALGAVVASTLGWSVDWAGLHSGALAGALAFAFILWGLAQWSQASLQSLLLVGVMLSLLGSSATALWLSVVDAGSVQSILFWLLGDLSLPRLSAAIGVLGTVLVITFLATARSGQLDALLLGQDLATSVGVDTRRLRRTLLIYASLLVAVCVGSAGMLGFVGLVVPHFVRTVVGSRHRRVLPLSALWGAVVLLFSDWIARIAFRPQEIPAGVITALWGAPAFVFLLLRRGASSRGSV